VHVEVVPEVPPASRCRSWVGYGLCGIFFIIALVVLGIDHDGGSAGRRLASIDVVDFKMRRPRRALLESDLSRGTAPRSVDLVLARRDEDISWLRKVIDDVPGVHTWVYEKGREAASPECAR
jgi:hypothetical protein